VSESVPITTNGSLIDAPGITLLTSQFSGFEASGGLLGT
jgi:hypothetical protein